MFKFFKSTKTRLIEYFNLLPEFNEIKQVQHKVIEIELPLIDRDRLIVISNNVIKDFGKKIKDLEVVYNEDSSIPLVNAIIISLNKKLPERGYSNLVDSNIDGFLEYCVFHKWGEECINSEGELELYTSMVPYVLYKIKN